MSDYKYPFIPRDYYPAVMYACKCIRKYGTFNAAVKAAAKAYGVDSEKVAEYVRQRQGAGQKGTTRKYRFFAALVFSDYYTADDAGTRESWDWDEQETKKHTRGVVIKATTEKNAEHQIDEMGSARFPYKSGSDYWSFHKKAFDSEKEAQQYLDSFNWERVKEYIPAQISETWGR